MHGIRLELQELEFVLLGVNFREFFIKGNEI